ncbi:UNVERIFIED_CONTAM: hypothetical protein PYX00_001543 [Menopon gallinae]|uniref:Uncharacterized protein n=1 Tax=Menopon gallinae TaxID=328185 RepID=A0AAW2IDW2_9NEOP
MPEEGDNRTDFTRQTDSAIENRNLERVFAHGGEAPGTCGGGDQIPFGYLGSLVEQVQGIDSVDLPEGL